MTKIVMDTSQTGKVFMPHYLDADVIIIPIGDEKEIITPTNVITQVFRGVIFSFIKSLFLCVFAICRGLRKGRGTSYCSLQLNW